MNDGKLPVVLDFGDKHFQQLVVLGVTSSPYY